MIMLDAITKEKLKDLLDDGEKTALFAEKIMEMICTDDESFEDIGEGIIHALLNDNADDLLISICGWSAKSIIEFIGGSN